MVGSGICNVKWLLCSRLSMCCLCMLMMIEVVVLKLVCMLFVWFIYIWIGGIVMFCDCCLICSVSVWKLCRCFCIVLNVMLCEVGSRNSVSISVVVVVIVV